MRVRMLLLWLAVLALPVTCQAQAWSDFNGDGAVDLADLALFVRQWRQVHPGGAPDPRFDADTDGVLGHIDALECVEAQPVPPKYGGLITDTAWLGAGCAAVGYVPGMGAWSDSGELAVPSSSGPFAISVFAVPTCANPQLAKAQVRLISPDGGKSVTLGGGAVSASGLQSKPLAFAGTDADMQALFGSGLGLPSSPTTDDLELVLETCWDFDQHERLNPPDDLDEALEANADTMAGWANAMPAGMGGWSPSRGAFIIGAAPGQWRIEALAQSGAGAFQVLAWVTQFPPTSTGSGTPDRVARELSREIGWASSAGVGTAKITADPGGWGRIAEFRSPRVGWSEEWVRAQIIEWWRQQIMACLQQGEHTAAYAFFRGMAYPQERPVTASGWGAWWREQPSRVPIVLGWLYRTPGGLSSAAAKTAFWRAAFAVWNWHEPCYLGECRHDHVSPWDVANPLRITRTVIRGRSVAELPLAPHDALKAYFDPFSCGYAKPVRDATMAFNPAGIVTGEYQWQRTALVFTPVPTNPLTGAVASATIDWLGLAQVRVQFIVKGTYTISGSTDGTADYSVDDAMHIFLNGACLFDDPYAAGARWPSSFTAQQGDVLELRVVDKAGGKIGCSNVYLTDDLGRSTRVAQAFSADVTQFTQPVSFFNALPW